MKINQFKSGVMLSYLVLILGNAISIIYTPIMLRLLGQGEFGLMSMVTSITGYLGLLSFGFAAAFIRYNARYRVAGDKEGESDLNGMYLAVYSAIGLLSLIIGIFLVIYSDEILGSKFTAEELKKAKILMAILVFNVSLSFPASVFGMYCNAYERFVFGRVIALISTILNPLMSLPLLFMGYGSVGVISVHTFVNLFNYGAMLIYTKKVLKMKITFRKFDLRIIKDILVFSSFIFLNMIADQIRLHANKLVAGKVIGTVGVAVYTIGSQFVFYYISIGQAISDIFIPRVNVIVATEKDDREVFSFFIRIGRILFIVLVLFLSGFILIGKEFILRWAGPEYRDSFYVAILLLASATLPLIQLIGIEIQKAKFMHKFRSVMLLATAVIGVIISIPLFHRYGVVGGAAGPTIMMVVGHLVLMNIYYKKRMGFDIMKFWAEIVKLMPAAVVSISIGFVMKYYIDLGGYISLAVFASIYLMVYSASMWLIGMNSYEKNLIYHPLVSMIRKIRKI